jgi:DNA-binding LacI/PurR family transcriptional regulator
MSNARRVTASDVADRAGVSQPTVSLVLSGNPRARVAATTRERVLQAASELGYEPNLLARGLVSSRSYTLAVIVPDLSNPFFTEVISGAERVAAQAGYGVLLCDTRETPLERHLAALRARMVDGVVVDAGGAALVGEALSGVRAVVLDDPGGAHPGVATDAGSAGRQAAEHLLQLGHRDLAYIGPASERYTFRMRERGWSQALKAAGIEIRSDRLRRAAPTVAGGAQAMRALLSAPTRPTAVFCANDLCALGALKASLTAGLEVPGDISIVGCDDIEMARVVTPELTTVRVPARALGARATRLLLEGIEARQRRPAAAQLLKVELVVRGTTSPPRGEASG